MSRRFLGGATARACAAIVLSCVPVGLRVLPCPAADGKETPGKNLFGLTRVWSIHLEIPAREYESLQPPPGGFGFPGAPPAPRDNKRDSERNLFGTEFRWAQGDFSAEGKRQGEFFGRTPK